MPLKNYILKLSIRQLIILKYECKIVHFKIIFLNKTMETLNKLIVSLVLYSNLKEW
jgi:hypothetical protein